MPFALMNEPSKSEISEAINYLLANFGSNIAADPNNGQVTGPSGIVLAYLYRYLAVKYADSFDGSVNFGDSPTNRLYYGLSNSDSSVESSNYADYIWSKVAGGGFGTTNFLWYITNGGRQIQFFVGAASPATGYATVGTSAIDLDIITSSTGNVSFLAYFQPANLQVVRTGNPLTPSFTGVQPRLYASAGGALATYVSAATDADVAFVNNTWRIGGSSTTGTGDITYNQITIGLPTDGGGYALWPTPTAMSGTPASLLVPVRYKNSAGVVSQANVAQIQLIFVDQGANGSSSRICFARVPGNPAPVNGTITTSGIASFPSSGQSSFTWGFSASWNAADPNPSSTDSLYQSDGIYDPVTDITSWTTPYISSLKVGTLSAITVNTGALTVQDTLTVSTTGNIKGGQTAFNTGTGFFLGYSSATYKFSIGSSTTSMTWDGSAMTITGGVIQTGTSGARLVMGGPSYAQAIIGYNSSGSTTMGINASLGQIYSSNYTGGIAGDFDSVSPTPALRGINTGTGLNNGCGVYGQSSVGFGGEFYGSTTRGTVYIDPVASLPSGIITGGLCVFNNHLYFCNGIIWVLVI